LADKVRLEIHYVDGHKRQRMGSFTRIDDVSVMHVCKILFDGANERRNRVRALLVDVWEFRPYVSQGDLFSKRDDRIMSLSNAIDEIRSKFGVQSLQNANVLQALMCDQCSST